jgi:hypothetical protein
MINALPMKNMMDIQEIRLVLRWTASVGLYSWDEALDPDPIGILIISRVISCQEIILYEIIF